MFSQEGALQKQHHRVINLASHVNWEPGQLHICSWGWRGEGHLHCTGAGDQVAGEVCALMTDLSNVCERQEREREKQKYRAREKGEKLLPKSNRFTFTVYVRLLVLEKENRLHILTHLNLNPDSGICLLCGFEQVSPPV